jgi:hypothetical protein
MAGSRKYNTRRTRPPGLDSTNYLRVTGLNDNSRVDRTDRPFFSFDGLGAREIDDAIRVTRSSGDLFRLEVAIVDGAQLAPDDQQTKRAIAQRQSHYSFDRSRDVLMLSAPAIRAMQLRGGRRRAMVLTQQFDADAQPMDTAAIEPSWINIHNKVSGSFLSNTSVNPQNPGPSHDMADFARRWLSPNGKPAALNRRSDRRMVDACMAFANTVVTDWVQQETIPIPFRTPKEMLLSDQVDDIPGTVHFTGSMDLGDLSPSPQLRANFTSPLRVAAHLITHQQVGARLAGIEVPYSANDINLLAPDLYVTK